MAAMIRLLKATGDLATLGIYLSMASVVTIMGIVTVDVILRNLLSRSIPGAVEISELLQGIMVFLGIAATLRSGHHISVDIVVERFPDRARAAVDLCITVLSLAVFALMTYALWAVATGPGSAYEISSILGIPTRPFRIVAAFGVGLMCLEILRLVLRCASGLRGRQ